MISATDFRKKQIVFLFTNEGEKLSFRNDNIIVKDKDGNIKHQSTCYRLFMLVIVGEISITSGVIKRAKKFGFVICMMTSGMKLYQTLGGALEGNTLLHKKQYEYTGNEIGKRIVINKLTNQKNAINYIQVKSCNAKETVQKIDGYIDTLQGMDHTLQEMLGIEGSAARIYFREIFSTAGWHGRQPRIKRDYINSTLDIGYTILFNFVDALLSAYDFDTYCGVLHKCFYMRKSLVCDLVEPLRPLTDLAVRKAINYGQCKEEDFEHINNRFTLKWAKSPQYTKFLVEPIMKNRDSIFSYIQRYYRSFMKGKEPEDVILFERRN